MQLVKWITTGLLVLPLAELAAFIVVASLVGFTTALGLVILISLLGVLVLRHTGGGAVTRLCTAAGRSEIRGVALDGPGAGTALGGILIVELKCVDRFAPTHLAQCLSYLQASGLTLALLLNFQHPKVECRRVAR